MGIGINDWHIHIHGTYSYSWHYVSAYMAYMRVSEVDKTHIIGMRKVGGSENKMPMDDTTSDEDKVVSHTRPFCFTNRHNRRE